MNIVTLYIIGVCCFDRIHSVEKEIKGLYGIISFKGFFPKGKLMIEYKPSSVSSMEIINLIENHGFAVVKKVQEEFSFDIYN